MGKLTHCLGLLTFITSLSYFSTINTGWQAHTAAGYNVNTLSHAYKFLNCRKILIICFKFQSVSQKEHWVTGQRTLTPRSLSSTQENLCWHRFSISVSPERNQAEQEQYEEISPCRGRDIAVLACHIFLNLFHISVIILFSRDEKSMLNIISPTFPGGSSFLVKFSGSF